MKPPRRSRWRRRASSATSERPRPAACRREGTPQTRPLPGSPPMQSSATNVPRAQAFRRRPASRSCKQSRDPPQCGLRTAVDSASSVNAAADCQEALRNRRIDESAAAADSCADNAAVMQPITWRLSSIPRWPTPLTVMVSTWAWVGTDRIPGTMMSSAAVTASHRTPSGTGAEARRCNSGEPGRSARTISTNGTRPAQGDPPNGEPRVTTVSTSPFRPPSRWPAR